MESRVDSAVDEIRVLFNILTTIDDARSLRQRSDGQDSFDPSDNCSIDTQQMLLEIFISRIFEVNPTLGSFLGKILHLARGRDPMLLANEIGTNLLFNDGDDFKEMLMVSEKISVDLFILTIKDIEYKATLDAFGLRDHNVMVYPQEDMRCGIKRRRSLWLAEVNGRKVGIGYVGEDGNVETTMAMTEYFFDVEFRQACLVGMAGGSEAKVGLGDVVIAKYVHDADRRKVVSARTILSEPLLASRAGAQVGIDEHTLNQEGSQAILPLENSQLELLLQRIDGSIPVDREIVRIADANQGLESQVSVFNSTQKGQDFLSQVTVDMPDIVPKGIEDKLDLDLRQHPSKDLDAVRSGSSGFRLHYAPLLASGALVESKQELIRLCKLYNEKACGVDMESYGFMLWCKKVHLDNFLVVRGIADFCTSGKQDERDAQHDASNTSSQEETRRKDWQYPATYRAAKVVKDVLLYEVFGW